jgi:Holliday junction resolvase RusA-like endonuclease
LAGAEDRIVSRAITVTIPGCPDAALSQNSRCHWRRRAAAVKQARSDAHVAALAARWEYLGMFLGGALFDGPVRVSAVIGWSKGRKRMDNQNAIACLKSHVDGLQDAAIVGDDKQVTEFEIQQGRDPDGVGFVRLEVRELAPAVGAEPGGDA